MESLESWKGSVVIVVGMTSPPGDDDHDTVPALATATTATGRLTVTAETVQLNAGEEAGGWLEFGGFVGCCHVVIYI